MHSPVNMGVAERHQAEVARRRLEAVIAAATTARLAAGLAASHGTLQPCTMLQYNRYTKVPGTRCCWLRSPWQQPPWSLPNETPNSVRGNHTHTLLVCSLPGHGYVQQQQASPGCLLGALLVPWAWAGTLIAWPSGVVNIVNYHAH